MPSAENFAPLSAEITRIFSEKLEVRNAIGQVLQAIGRQLAWDMAVFWMVDDRRGALTLGGEWKSHTIPSGTDFELVTRARVFAPGQGTPGVCWIRNEVIWATSLETNPLFSRASVASSAGVKTCVEVPIGAESGILGILELISVHEIPPDPASITALTALGGQIGIFLERARLNADLIELDSQFLMVASAASDAIVTIDESSKILFANSALAALFGYTREDLIGSNLGILMPERMRARHSEGVKRFLSTGTRNIPWDGVLLPALRRDGTEIEVQIAFGRFQRQGRTIFTGFIRPPAKLSASD